MKQEYKQIELKNREKITVTISQWANIQPKWQEVSSGKVEKCVVDLGTVTFDVADIKFCRSVYQENYQQAAEKREYLSDTERSRSISRLQAYKAAVFGQRDFVGKDDQQQQWHDEMKIFVDTGVYPSSDWRREAGITRDDWKKAEKATFQVFFDDQDHQDATRLLFIQRYVWDDQRDPRTFDLDKLVAEGREYAPTFAAERVFTSK